MREMTEESLKAAHFRTLGDIGSSGEDSKTAIGGETFEVEEMYPAYDAIAKLQEEKAAQLSIHYALEAEKIHASLYRQDRRAVEAGQDMELAQIYICTACGYTGEGEVLERCPVCGATKENFRTF